MRKDQRGYFYFVDRLGDTFRWKGENVATAEVADAICRFPGIADAVDYGVTVPGAEGRAGMAAIVADEGLDLAALHLHLRETLPHYARPLFLRLRSGLDMTGTFKHTKDALVREGYDPTAIRDAVYVNDRDRQMFVRLDMSLYDRVQSEHRWSSNHG
jgi:fatty-acyl-CoA synthase